MPEPRGDLELAQEPLSAEGRAELRAQHLDGDVPVMPDVWRMRRSYERLAPAVSLVDASSEACRQS
jgi:hypothetical protein